jgi:hypothetical protein
MKGRSIGLDVHRDFCEVTAHQAGKVAHYAMSPPRRWGLA